MQTQAHMQHSNNNQKRNERQLIHAVLIHSAQI